MHQIFRRDFDDPEDYRLKALRRNRLRNNTQFGDCAFHTVNPYYDGLDGTGFMRRGKVGPKGRGVRDFMDRKDLEKRANSELNYRSNLKNINKKLHLTRNLSVNTLAFSRNKHL